MEGMGESSVGVGEDLRGALACDHTQQPRSRVVIRENGSTLAMHHGWRWMPVRLSGTWTCAAEQKSRAVRGTGMMHLG